MSSVNNNYQSTSLDPITGLAPPTQSASPTSTTNTYSSSISSSTSSSTPTKTAATGASAPVLAEPRISISDYSRAITATQHKISQTSYDDMAKDAVGTTKYYLGVIENCARMKELMYWSTNAKENLDKMNTTYNEQVAQINILIAKYNDQFAATEPFLPPPNDTVKADAPTVAQMNAAIANYNAAKASYDKSIKDYNAAQIAYNAAPSTATYNAAVAAYAASSATATFNAALAVYNAAPTTITYNAAKATYDNATATYQAAVADHDAGKMSDAAFKTATNNYVKATDTFKTATDTLNAADATKTFAAAQAVYAADPATVTFNAAKAAYDAADATKNLISTKAAYDAAPAAFAAATTKYNASVEAYNAYGAERNLELKPIVDAYNQEVIPSFNDAMKPLKDQIDLYNSFAGSMGLPLLSYPKLSPLSDNTYLWQPLGQSPTGFPIRSVPNRPGPIPDIPGSYIQDTAALNDQIQVLIGAIVDDMMGRLMLMDSQVRKSKASIEYYANKHKSIHKGGNSVIDNSYIQQTISSQLTGGAVKGGGSGEFSSLIGGSQSSGFAAMLSQQLNKPVPMEVTSLMQKAQLDLLTVAGLTAGAVAMSILGKDLSKITQNGPAGQIAAAIGFAKQVAGITKTGCYEKASEAALEKGGIKGDDQSIGIAANGLKLQAALMSLFQLSRALDSPGLVQQMIGLAGGDQIPAIKDLLNQAPGTKLSETLSDPFAQAAVKAVLSELLTSGSDLKSEKANAIIQAAVTEVMQDKSISSEMEFGSALFGKLRDQNIDTIKALVLSHAAVDSIRDDRLRPELNLALNKPVLENIIRTTEFFTKPDIASAVNKALRNDDLHSQRALRKELINEFKLQGDSRTEAKQKANEILNFINHDAIAAKRISTPNIDGGVLQSNLERQIQAVLPKTSEMKTTAIAEQVATAIVSKKTYESSVALNDAVVDALKQAGIRADKAHEIAEKTTVPVSRPLSEVDPLVQKGNIAQLTEDQLVDLITKKATKLIKPELDVVKSHEVAKEFVEAVMGDNPFSVVNVIKDSIQTVQKQESPVVKEKFADSFHEVMRPNVEFYKFVQELLDPGNSVLYGAAGGFTKNEAFTKFNPSASAA